MNWKEARDWTTCVVSIAAPIMIGVGAMMMRNQRLEIAVEMRNQYVQQDEYKTEMKKLEGQDQDTWRKLGETNGKIDALTLQSATSTQILLDLKEEVKALKAR
jgi:hypothetical protein